MLLFLTLILTFFNYAKPDTVSRPRFQDLEPGDTIVLTGKLDRGDSVELNCHYQAFHERYKTSTDSPKSMQFRLEYDGWQIKGNNIREVPKAKPADDTGSFDFQKTFEVRLQVRKDNMLSLSINSQPIQIWEIDVRGVQLLHFIGSTKKVSLEVDDMASLPIYRHIDFNYEKGFEFTFTMNYFDLTFNFLDNNDNVAAQLRIIPQENRLSMASNFGDHWTNQQPIEDMSIIRPQTTNTLKVVNTLQGLFVVYNNKHTRCYKHVTTAPWRDYTKMLATIGDGWVDRIRPLADSTPECKDSVLTE